MRKFFVIALLISLCALGAASVSAQDAAATPEPGAPLPSCSQDDLTTTETAVQQYSDGISTLSTTYNLSGDPNSASYGQTIVALDAVSYQYWNTVFPALPSCQEAQVLAYYIGTIYDEYLTIGLLQNAGAWLAASNDTADAQVLQDQATQRQSTLDTQQQALAGMSLSDFVTGMTGNSLPSCTADQTSTLNTNFATAMSSLGDILTQSSDQPVIAFGVTEGASFGFDNAGLSDALSCQENVLMGWYIHATLSDLNIIMGLSANATLESAGGNSTVAQAMVTSAQNRLADFQTSWAYLSQMMATPAQ